VSLVLGTTRNRRPVVLSDEERSRHVHVVGASGTGKSKLFEALIRRDILTGRGLCLIDPHGTLADSIVEWCAALRLTDKRHVHVLDLKDDNWSMGFNSLGAQTARHVEARVDAMVATCAQVWGGEDINQTPLLTTCLQLVFYALAMNRLTLAEAVELTATNDLGGLRSRLTVGLPNPVYDAYWRDTAALPRREFEEHFSSTRRRLLRFLGSPTVRRLVGQRDHALDVRQIMDDGDILIVNLAKRGGVSEESARLVGALLMSELRLSALSRDPATALRRPFSLYVDECYQFLTGDVESMLDETRKFGLHLILGHQRLGQLRARSDEMLNAVVAGAQTKIVFGGMNDEDAEYMARQVFRSSFRTDRVKHALDKPVTVGEVPFWLDSQSWTESNGTIESSTESESWMSTSTSSESLSQSFGPQSDEAYNSVVALASALASGEGGGSSSTTGTTRGSSSSYGRAQAFKPVRVVMPTAVYSLEEELHLAIVKLRELPNQAAIVKRRGRPPVRFRPATVRPAAVWPDLTDRFLDGSREQSPYIVRAETADAEISTRVQGLREKEPDDTASQPFWHQ
jgi:hypothetical protein